MRLFMRPKNKAGTASFAGKRLTLVEQKKYKMESTMNYKLRFLL